MLVRENNHLIFFIPGLVPPSNNEFKSRGASYFERVTFSSKCHGLLAFLLVTLRSLNLQRSTNAYLLIDSFQFCEKIFLKPGEVQSKFFQIVEFLVTRLRFVPCKELIAISLVLKSQQSIGCYSLAAKSLSGIIKFDPIFKDVFREVGEFYAGLSHLLTHKRSLF